VEIIVLLKQVPSTESIIEIEADGKSIKKGDIKWVMNPYDELAVEEAIRIRDAQGGSVTILTAGPDKAAEAIRTALAMGADKGVLINDPQLDPGNSLAVAAALAKAAQGLSFDLIAAGMRAVDDDGYLVGTAVAEALNIPCVSMVIKQEIKDGAIVCHKTVDGGTAVVESSLPMLFTAQRGLNEPRYASLPGIMKAKKKPIDTKTLADLGLDVGDFAGCALHITALNPPPERKAGRMIAGDSPRAKAAELVRVLHEEAKVI